VLAEDYYEKARRDVHQQTSVPADRRKHKRSSQPVSPTYSRAMLAVREIWRYAVKSMGGESLTSAALGPLGIAGDRSWGVRDRTTGMILTGRREPRLLMATARLVGGAPAITVDDATVMRTSGELSAWLDRPVELVPAGDTPGTFENPMDVDREDDWVSWQSQPGTFHDGRSTVSLVSTTSLAGYEPPRFRINVILDGEGEDDLVGSDITIGTARLRVRKPIDRCVMVARAQAGIAADLGVLKRVVRERDNLMGVGAIVLDAGTITVGDQVTE
jgi:uncharacterized protein